jgi:membrane associated rhomboid family serine protease
MAGAGKATYKPRTMFPLRDHLPTRSVPVVTYLLLAANLSAYLLELALIGAGYAPQRLVLDWGLVPLRLLHDPLGEGFTLLSSMFMHDPSGWLHLGGNMLFLWIFGDNVEDALGSLRYALFYLLGGLGAAATQVLLDPTSRVPMVGASGAIAAVLAAYATLYPHARITVLNPVVLLWLFFGPFWVLPAWLVIGSFFLMTVWDSLGVLAGAGDGGGVAFFAHVGGFVTGLVLIRSFGSRRMPRMPERTPDPWRGWRPPRRNAPVERRGRWG